MTTGQSIRQHFDGPAVGPRATLEVAILELGRRLGWAATIVPLVGGYRVDVALGRGGRYGKTARAGAFYATSLDGAVAIARQWLRP